MKTTIQPKINFPDVCHVDDQVMKAAYQKVVDGIDSLMTKLSAINEASDLAQVSFINLCASEGRFHKDKPELYLEMVFDYDHHGAPEYVTEYVTSAKTLVDTLNSTLTEELSSFGLDNFVWVQQEGTRAKLHEEV